VTGRRPGPFALLSGLSLLVVLLFLTVPVAAIFAEVPPADLLGHLDDPAVTEALRVTAVTNGVALLLTVALGTPAAYLLARGRVPARDALVTLVELPLVLPPAVAGIALLAAFGRMGLLGEQLSVLGVEVAFTRAAVVMAILFVAGPLYVRQAIAAFAALDDDVLLAARTLGAGPARTFSRVALPMAAGGLGAGAALSLARGVGEFGATLMFAGSLPGVTRTATLAVYDALGGDLDVALALGALLVVLSAAVLLVLKLLLSWRISDSTSASPAAGSPSISR
jgi:molybdate transport system permease protein